MWTQYKACPSQERERSEIAIPIFYRACQGHSTFVASIERMCVPCDPGQVRCHGSLLHFTDMQTFLESTDGRVTLPEERLRALPRSRLRFAEAASD
eukprot:1713614-Pyramimonas_sp.AAC.1